MRKTLSRTALLLMLPIFLASCASYKARPLDTLSFNIEAPLENLYTSCKAFSAEDSQRYLGKNVLARGYQPVQISIRNSSKDTFYLPLDGISLPHTDPETVSEEMHFSTATRTVAMTGAGLVGANLVVIPSLILSPILGPLSLVVPLATLVTPPIMGGVKSSEANKAMDRDFDKKGARDAFIGPHATVNMLLFVPEELYRSDFTMTLKNSNTSEVFVIDMHCM